MRLYGIFSLSEIVLIMRQIWPWTRVAEIHAQTHQQQNRPQCAESSSCKTRGCRLRFVTTQRC